MTSPTIFQKIIQGEIPCEKLYEDELCLAFNDISAQAPIHYLVIPKQPIPSLKDCKEIDQNLLGHLILDGQKIAEEKKTFKLEDCN